MLDGPALLGDDFDRQDERCMRHLCIPAGCLIVVCSMRNALSATRCILIQWQPSIPQRQHRTRRDGRLTCSYGSLQLGLDPPSELMAGYVDDLDAGRGQTTDQARFSQHVA